MRAVAIVVALAAGACSTLLGDGYDDGARLEGPDAALDSPEGDADAATAVDAGADGDAACHLAGPRRGNVGFAVPGTDRDWSNPQNAVADDDARAFFIVNQGQRSDPLIVRDFGFTLPPNTRIAGITVGIECSAAAGQVADEGVWLRRPDGTPSAGTRVAAPAGWPTMETTRFYGASSDLWGSTWSAAQVNDPEFGVVLVARANGNFAGDDEGRVNTILVSVAYCE
jgi:hypothetical protein